MIRLTINPTVLHSASKSSTGKRTNGLVTKTRLSVLQGNYRVYSNRMQVNKIITFAVKVFSRYINIHYEKSQNANFLAL